jgi:hypothetical protein
MTQEPPEPGWAPEPPKVKKGTVFKIGIVMAIVLLGYWLWRIYTHLPPARPLEYPADYIPLIESASRLNCRRVSVLRVDSKMDVASPLR